MTDSPRQLKRELGVFGATLLGLGSILGTGVFVSLGIAAGIAGPAVLIAIVLAGFVALCNALSSAQLAAAHPVAGGTYEYGYKYLHPLAGFSAGWMFMIAKSASAATAALALTHYAMSFTPDSNVPFSGQVFIAAVSMCVVMVFVGITLAGVRRATWVNTILVATVVIVLGGITMIALMWLSQREMLGIGPASPLGQAMSPPWGPQQSTTDWALSLLYATALMFVAYTGYGRVATLGEEVHDPTRTIPRAILATLGVSIVLYLGVGAVTVMMVYAPPTDFGGYGYLPELEGDEPYLVSLVETVLPPERLGIVVLAIGAIAAMGGVLLNLILGLSRVLLAMGRRRDVPRGLSKLNKSGTTPTASVVVVGVIIGGLVLIGDVKATWSLSAFTVLIYYGITNLAALRLPPQHRRYPRAFSWIGLAACAGLALSVDVRSMIIGSSILLAGFVWYAAVRAMRGNVTTDEHG